MFGMTPWTIKLRQRLLLLLAWGGAVVGVEASAPSQTDRSPAATLGLWNPRLAITRPPRSQRICEGSNVSFTVGYSGLQPSFQWYSQGAALPGATNQVLTLLAVAPNQAGDYWVIATNAVSRATSAVAVLTVAPLATVESPDAKANGTVWALAVQRDGKILLGGEFTTVGGRLRRSLARLHPGGDLDATFAAGTEVAPVWSVTVQADDRILLAGGFKTLAGQTRSRIGRLNSDGTLDPTFHPEADGSIHAVAFQADGQILVGGSFTNLDGQRSIRIGRLHPEGRLDGSFYSEANGTVFSLAVQPDGKILLAGAFTTLAGQPRPRLGRLHPDGSPDSSFNPGADGTVRCLMVQADGRIVVGGDFSTLGGQARRRLGRLEAEGSLDESFDPGADNTVYSLVAQTDGTVLVGGAFATIAGQARRGLARLQADGNLDETLLAGTDQPVCALGLQADGSILVGGSFDTLNGQARGRMGRLRNGQPAVQSLTLSGPTLTWLRGGASPEVGRATFEASINSGSTWWPLGPGVRNAGGWQFSGLPPLPNLSFRARGFIAAGTGNASGWLVESGAGAPLITAQPQPLRTHATATVTLDVTTDGTPPLSWWWHKDGVALAEGARGLGTRGNRLVLPRVSATDAGDYSVLISNAFGWTVSQPARVTVVDPLIVTQPVTQEVFVGDNAVFRVGAGGTPPLRYQWYREGAALPGVGEERLTVSNVPRSEDGSQFQVVASSLGGSATSAVVALKVATPAAPDSFNPGANKTVWSLAVQKDGKIVVGGDFTILAGQPRSGLGRLEADGRLDASFTPGVEDLLMTPPSGDGRGGRAGRPDPAVMRSLVKSLVVQTDGAILVGGGFTRLAGEPRPCLGRLHPDGTLDRSFNPGTDNQVQVMVLQPDGQILVGGDFATLGGVARQRLGRLHPDGSLDTTFNPGADTTVYALGVQADGKILVGGFSTIAGGQIRGSLRRLLPDGRVDATFTAETSPPVWALALQADGRILVANRWFPGGPTHGHLGRLLSNGGLDDSFAAETDRAVFSMAVQADGKVLVGGSFTSFDGQPRRGLGRLHADGRPDPTFTPTTEQPVYAVAVQADGAILVGGSFTNLAGQPRSRLGRLRNTGPASESLNIQGPTVTWLRAGNCPEVVWTTFDLSTNGGATWAGLGAGMRVPGGWQLSGGEALSGATVRVRGLVAGGGYSSASGWLVEAVAGAPSFTLQPQPVRTNVGATCQFRASAVGSTPLVWQWRKDGVDLTEDAHFTGTRSNVLTIHQALADDAGTYAALVSDAQAWAGSLPAHLTLADPFITDQPLSQVVSLGTSAEFRAQARGTPPLSLQWSKGGVPIVGATGEALTLPCVLASDHGVAVTLAVSNRFGSVTSAVAVLTVVDPPFLASLNGTVWSLAVERDGKILVGGDFNQASGQVRMHLARLHPDGTLDASFSPVVARPPVLALAVQPDDRVLVAGSFTQLGNQPRHGLGRLHPDGTLDATFDPKADNTVRAILPRADGALWIAGDFTTLGGERSPRIARLNPEGTLDTTLSASADGPVHCLAPQPEAKILVGGAFTALHGQPCDRLGRLNSDGSWDGSFNPRADGTVWCLAVQADGRILVGGAFTVLGRQTCPGLGRLNPDGSLDRGFNPEVAGPLVSSLALQADGKILVAGTFASRGGPPRPRLVRLNPDGSADKTFAWEADHPIYALGIQADGRVLAGGAFTTLGGQPRSRLARLHNTLPASQSLSLNGPVVTWRRGEASPEVSAVTLDLSTNRAGTWTSRGAGVRVPGGWEFAGLELPDQASLRVRGFVSGGTGNSSHWWIEAGAGWPYLLAQPRSQQVFVGATALFKVAAGGTPPLNYQWYRDGSLLGQTTGASLTVANLPRASEASQFWVVVSNAVGSVTSAVARLTVISPARTLLGSPSVTLGQSTNQATVVWRTSVPLNSWVEYGLTLAYGRTAGSSNQVSRHEVTLTGLEPDRLYFYRVRSGGAVLANGQFRSAEPPRPAPRLNRPPARRR